MLLVYKICGSRDTVSKKSAYSFNWLTNTSLVDMVTGRRCVLNTTSRQSHSREPRSSSVTRAGIKPLETFA